MGEDLKVRGEIIYSVELSDEHELTGPDLPACWAGQQPKTIRAVKTIRTRIR